MFEILFTIYYKLEVFQGFRAGFTEIVFQFNNNLVYI